MADDYEKEGAAVRYGGFRIEVADAATFERLSPWHGRDRTFVYRGATVIPDADPATFESLSENHGRDARRVFYHGTVLEGADPLTFVCLSESYARDASQAFWGVNAIDAPLDLVAFRVLGPDHATDGRLTLHGNTVMEEVDRESLRVLSDRVAVDSGRVYYDGTPLEGAEPASFEVLDDAYSRDRRRVFHYRELLSEPQPASFEIIAERWTRDARQVFRDNEPVPGADPATFRLFGENHALDAARAYYLSSPLKGVDVASVELLGPDCLRDRKCVFHRGDLVKGAHRDSFEVVSDEFSKDRNRVYYRDQAIPYLDAGSFEVLRFANYSGYVRDSSAAYYFREPRAKLKVTKLKADLPTFVALDDDYAKDRSHVFFRGRKVPNGDPDSFRLLTMYYAKDGKQVYYSSSWDRFRILEDAHPETFLDMGSEFGTDRSTLYYLGKKANDSKTNGDWRIVGFIKAHPELQGYWWTTTPEPASGSFTVLEDGYARDDHFLYHNGLRLEDVDARSFEVLAHGFVKDARHVFWFDVSRRGDVWLPSAGGGWQEGKGGVLHGEKLAGAQPASFVTLAHGYARDGASCYYRHHLLEGADPGTFEVVAEDWAGDRSMVFCGETRVRGADRGSFEVLSPRFARDRAAAYWDGKRIADADPSSFEVLLVDGPNHYARDRRRVYNANGHRVVKGLDGGRFRFLNRGYGVDGHAVYSTASERPSSTKDAATFEALSDWLARDKRAVHLDGKETRKLTPRTLESTSTRPRDTWTRRASKSSATATPGTSTPPSSGPRRSRAPSRRVSRPWVTATPST